MDCKLCGRNVIFFSNSCGTPLGKYVCYSSTKCSKQSSCRINKQGDTAKIKAGACAVLLLAEPFSPWQREAIIWNSTAVFHCLNHRNPCHSMQKFRNRHHDPSSCAWVMGKSIIRKRCHCSRCNSCLTMDFSSPFLSIFTICWTLYWLSEYWQVFWLGMPLNYTGILDSLSNPFKPPVSTVTSA